MITLAISFLLTVGQSPGQTDAVQKGTGQIAPYEGRMLSDKIPEDREFLKFVHTRFPATKMPFAGETEFEHALRIGSEYVVIAANNPILNPGSGSISAYWFNSKLKPVAESHVDSGNRTYYTSCKVRLATPDLPTTVIDTELFGMGTSGVRQLFAIENHGIHLIWLGKSDGTLTPNIYSAPNIGCDTDDRQRTKLEMLAILKAGDPIRQLEALTWFDGDHLQPSPYIVDVLLEPISERIKYRSKAGDRLGTRKS